MFSLGQHSVEMSAYACTDLSLISVKNPGKAKQGQHWEENGKIKVRCMKHQKCMYREPEWDVGHASLRVPERSVKLLNDIILGDMKGKGNGYRPAATRISTTRLPLSAAGDGGGSLSGSPMTH